MPVLLRRIHTLFCLPPFVWIPLDPLDFPVFHTPKQAHSESYAQVLMARMKRMLFPSLRMFVPDSARVGMLSDGFLPRGARKISHMKGRPVRREMPKTQNTPSRKQTRTNTYTGAHANTLQGLGECVRQLERVGCYLFISLSCSREATSARSCKHR